MSSSDKILNVDSIINDADCLYEDFLENIATKKFIFSDFKEVMKVKYENLFKDHETITKLCMSKNYDSKRLRSMLTMANKVRKSEISEHQASIEVGKELVDNIVKPQLNKAGIYPNNNK